MLALFDGLRNIILAADMIVSDSSDCSVNQPSRQLRQIFVESPKLRH